MFVGDLVLSMSEALETEHEQSLGHELGYYDHLATRASPILRTAAR